MQIVEAKLMDLKLDPSNVRQTDRAPDEGLLASIRAKGLIVPLTVRKNGAGWFVTDGGKRLAALHILVRDGDIDKTLPVPCVVREDDAAAAADTSLTINFIRDDMHPVDIYEAFGSLRTGGKSTEDIAKEYALPIPTVRQYLALGALSPKVREAWKAGEFGDDDGHDDPQDIAQLFTLAGDHAAQDAIYEKLKKQKRLTNEWQVKEAIVGNSNEGGKLVAFVGADTYKAAGGKLREDLFGSDHVIEDLPIAKKLADEKLIAECQKAIGLGWSWAEPLSALPKGCEHSWQRAYDSLEQFPKTKRKDWGLALYIDRDGKLDEHILQKPKQKKAADKASKTREKNKAAASGEAPEKDDAHISQALNHKLSITLTEAAAEAIVAQPDLAFAMAIAALMAEYNSSNVKLRCDGLGSGLSDEDEDEEWEFDKALAHVLKLTPKQRSASFAMYVGRSFNFQRHQGNPLDPEKGDAHVVCASIDQQAMKKALLAKFDAADYFTGASKTIAVAALKECDPNYNVAGLSAMKKAEIATVAAGEAKLTGWLPPELRTKHYDGPGSKGFRPKVAVKSATKPAAKAKAAKKTAR